MGFWEQFGDIIGEPAKPLPVPQGLGGVTLGAVAIALRYAARINPLDLNVVAQRAELGKGQLFDLVIATNILVYYDRFQQALAMASIASMMSPGGVSLTNDALSSHHVRSRSLELVDRHAVSYSANGPYGDNVSVYRRR